MTTAGPDLRVKSNAHVFLLEGEGVGAPGLRATCCRICGAYSLGRVMACSFCLSRELDSCAAGQKGEIIEYAMSDHPAGGFAAPYAIAMVRTSEGLTLISPLVGNPSLFARGAPLHFVLVDRDEAGVTFAYAAGDQAA